jgi:hypothetical protein
MLTLIAVVAAVIAVGTAAATVLVGLSAALSQVP